jgi:hypothetical protein
MTVTELFPTRTLATAHALTMQQFASRVLVSPVPGGFAVSSTFTYTE